MGNTIRVEEIVSMTDVSQNWTKVAKVIKDRDRAVVMRNNKPAYVIISFDKWVQDQDENRQFEAMLDKVTAEHLPVIKRLAE